MNKSEPEDQSFIKIHTYTVISLYSRSMHLRLQQYGVGNLLKKIDLYSIP